MRLPDLVNKVRRKLSEGANLAKNPMAVFGQRARKAAQTLYEKVDLGGKADTEDTSQDDLGPVEAADTDSESATDRTGDAAAVTYSTDLAPAVAPAVPEMSDAERAALYRYPARLQPGEALQRGWWGRYTVGKCLQDRGWLRHYEGTQDNGGESVWIYEYSLSLDIFDGPDIDKRKRAFKQLIDLNLRLGDGSDFRILKPRDVIVGAQNTCYLVTKPLGNSLLLKDYLAADPAPVDPIQIRQFLGQVLQTLQYLQTYRVHWPNETSEVGIPHGSLSDDRLWLQQTDTVATIHRPSFFVYLSRLALWEHLFYLGDASEPVVQPLAERSAQLGSVEQDLESLGHLCFALIKGSLTPGDPTDKSLWPDDPKIRVFYPYLLRLLGRDPEIWYKSIDVAIAALYNLPDCEEPEPAPDLVETAETDRQAVPYGLVGLAGVTALSLGLLMWWLARPGRSPLQLAACQQQTCGLQAVADPPQGPVYYSLEADSYWYESFSRGLRSPLQPSQKKEPLFEQVFEQRNGQTLELKKPSNQPEVSRPALLSQLRSQVIQAGFTLTHPGLAAHQVPTFAEAEPVAYDGIAVFVAYSDSQSRVNAPKQLQGRIDLEQLRQLLLSDSPQLQDKPVRFYLPEDSYTLELLLQMLFSDPEQAEFARRHLFQVAHAQTYPARVMYEQVLQDFESQTEDAAIGIGFDRISNTIGQCSVYPLALTHRGQTFPVFVDHRGRPVSADTDLCGDKGDYWVNSQIFGRSQRQSYPLGYAMTVIYPKCTDTDPDICQAGQSLAQKLLTPEGQYLISETGLVPAMPMQEIRQQLWSYQSP